MCGETECAPASSLRDPIAPRNLRPNRALIAEPNPSTRSRYARKETHWRVAKLPLSVGRCSCHAASNIRVRSQILP
jgi:hypothetical protein